MFGKKHAIRQYYSKLPAALTQRYGGSKLYTKAQVDKTVADLNLNMKYVRYAYLMFCDIALLNDDVFQGYRLESMSETLAALVGTSAGGVSFTSVFYGDSGGSDGGGGGGGFGGGGGGDC